MGDKIASLYAEIGGDTTKLERSLKETKSKLGELGAEFGRQSAQLPKLFTGLDLRPLRGQMDDFIGSLQSATPAAMGFARRATEISNAFEKGEISRKTAIDQMSALRNEMKEQLPLGDRLKENWKSLAVTAGVVVGGAMAIYGGLKKVYDIGKEGTQIEFTAQKFDRLSAAVGTTSDKLMRDLRLATEGTRSNLDLMNGAADLLSLGLAKDADQVVRFSRVIGGLGMNTNQLVLTLTNRTTARFDQLGVRVDGFKDKVKALEEQGYDTNAAFAEAFLRQAEEQLGRVGTIAETDAGKIAKMEAATKNLGDAFKVWLAPGVAAVANAIADSITAEQNFEDALDSLNERYLSGTLATEDYRAGVQKVADSYNKNRSVFQKTKDAFNGIEDGAEKAAKETIELTDAQIALINKWKTATPIAKDMHEKMQNLAGSTGEYGETVSFASIATKELSDDLLLSIASAGMSEDAIIGLQKAMGMVDEATVRAYSQIQIWRGELSSGRITEEEYTALVAGLASELDIAKVALDDMGGAAETAKAKVLGLNDIDLNLASTIETELDKIEYYLAGGLPLQQVTEDIQEAIASGKITPEQGKELLGGAFVASQALQVEMNNITADEAAKNVTDTLGGSLTDNKQLVLDTKAELNSFPKELSTDLYITVHYNNPGGKVVTDDDIIRQEKRLGVDLNGNGEIGAATGADYIIPAGYTESWRLPGNVVASSGERVTVTPVGQSDTTGDIHIHLEGATITSPIEYDTLMYQIATDIRKRM